MEEQNLNIHSKEKLDTKYLCRGGFKHRLKFIDPYLCLVVSQSFASANKWGQNQLEESNFFCKTSLS
jgi:hypothetical protein